MKRVVVFCCDGYLSLGLIRSLGEAGYRPECYCSGNHCEFFMASRYVSKSKHFKSVKDTFDYLLQEYPCYQDKPYLFTIPDEPAYLVDMHYDQLKEKFILMNAGGQGRIAYWMDKRNQAEIAPKHGLCVPWTIEIAKHGDIPDTIEYPVFTKSVKSVDGGKKDEGVCRNRSELERKRDEMMSNTLLVMKYIRKKKEIDYFGMSINGKVYMDFHDEISRFPDGAYGYYGAFMRCKNDETYQKCVSMMEEIGYNGLFDIEFLLGDDDVLYFMEINFRADGAIYKLAEGVNLPAAWCELACSTELPECLPIKKDYFVGMTEVQDFKLNVLIGHKNPFKWFWQFCTADRHMLFNLKDPKPILVRLLSLLHFKHRGRFFFV